MSRKCIAVLRGGPSSEHDVSMKTGKAVIDALYDKHIIKDIIVDKEGNWTIDGEIVDPAKAVRMANVVFNAMHGEYGEDGQVQEILESLNIPFTGSKSSASRISIDKVRTKQKYAEHGLKTPHAKVMMNNGNIDEMAIELFRTMVMPVILKPVDKGSSVGVYFVKDFASLHDALYEIFHNTNVEKLLIEEYIQGKEATVGVVENFRNKSLYPLLPIEILPPSDRDFFDMTCKYDGTTEEICPGNFTKDEKQMLQDWAVKAHEILGLRHYSRTDFILHPRRGLYVLETNSLPGMTEHSLMPKAIEAVGSSYLDFLEHLVDLAIKGK